jgi:hypothetical protein
MIFDRNPGCVPSIRFYNIETIERVYVPFQSERTAGRCTFVGVIVQGLTTPEGLKYNAYRRVANPQTLYPICRRTARSLLTLGHY